GASRRAPHPDLLGGQLPLGKGLRLQRKLPIDIRDAGSERRTRLLPSWRRVEEHAVLGDYVVCPYVCIMSTPNIFSHRTVSLFLSESFDTVFMEMAPRFAHGVCKRLRAAWHARQTERGGGV